MLAAGAEARRHAHGATGRTRRRLMMAKKVTGAGKATRKGPTSGIAVMVGCGMHAAQWHEWTPSTRLSRLGVHDRRAQPLAALIRQTVPAYAATKLVEPLVAGLTSASPSGGCGIPDTLAPRRPAPGHVGRRRLRPGSGPRLGR